VARKTRSYSKAEQAAALAALASNAGNLARTAQETGVPRKTLAEWQKRQGRARGSGGGGEGGEGYSPPKKGGSPPAKGGRPAADPPTHDHIVQAGDTLADELERAVRGVVLKLFDKDKLDDASLKETATAAGILIDKIQLLRGQPTAINAQALTDEQRLARLRELADRGRSRRLGTPDAGGAG
jgi:hypothetical protein